MENRIVDFDTKEGRELLRNLYAFSFGLFNRLYKAEVNERGKSHKDYVHDAIEKHLKGEDGFDQGRSPIDYHLKYHIIRRSMYNDLSPRAKRNYKKASENLLQEANMTPKLFPFTEPSEDAIFLGVLEYDRKLIFDALEKKINGDDVQEQIYLAVCHDDFGFSDRSEICEQFKISYPDFDNGKRRFVTTIRNTFKELKLT